MESGEPVSVNKREYSELIRKQRERLRSAREEEKENAEMSSSSSSSVLAADAKLVPRITIYLEKNKDKQYIDIEAMCKWLHNKYPEYNRKKYRVFKTQVEGAFQKLLQGGMPSSDDKKSSKDEAGGSGSSAEKKAAKEVKKEPAAASAGDKSDKGR